MDVHARSVVACALDGRSGEVVEARLSPEYGELLAWLRRLRGPRSPSPMRLAPPGSGWPGS